MSKYTEIETVHGVCTGKTTAAIQQYRQRNPQQQLPYRRVFTCVEDICEKLVSFRVETATGTYSTKRSGGRGKYYSHDYTLITNLMH
jgi:hypothetical protein